MQYPNNTSTTCEQHTHHFQTKTNKQTNNIKKKNIP